jgi:hypothetical protein
MYNSSHALRERSYMPLESPFTIAMHLVFYSRLERRLKWFEAAEMRFYVSSFLQLYHDFEVLSSLR